MQFEINGNRVSFKIYGKGKPVFLIHGFAEDTRVWDDIILRLPKNYLLIVPNLPGYGTSNEKVDFNQLPDMESMASLMNTLLLELVKAGIVHPNDLSTCKWIGHSMGGYICLAIEAHYPENVGAILLFHSTAFPDTEDKKEQRLKSMEFISKHGSCAFLEQAIPNLFSDQYKTNHADQINQLIAAYKYISPETLCHSYKVIMSRPDRSQLLKDTNKTIGFIIGGLDKAVPLKDSLDQCQFPKNSYIQFLSGSAHMGMKENTLESTEFLEWFLQQI